MPMIDLCVPEGALDPPAEARLLEDLTAPLIRLEGFDPADEKARAATWIFLHRPEAFVAGAPARRPRYRVIPSAAEGLSEIPDGTWGARGQVRRLPDIVAHFQGEQARPEAERRLADRRRQGTVVAGRADRSIA